MCSVRYAKFFDVFDTTVNGTSNSYDPLSNSQYSDISFDNPAATSSPIMLTDP